ncbi:MAG: hypothetical protein AAGF59_14460 [Pseudomonadota bacterium]
MNPAASRRTRRPVSKAALVFAAALVVGVAIDFWHFSTLVMRSAAEPNQQSSADAIVVLTGGADRIKDAANLLNEGRAARLLISGVHPETTIGEIARSADIAPGLLNCCFYL